VYRVRRTRRRASGPSIPVPLSVHHRSGLAAADNGLAPARLFTGLGPDNELARLAAVMVAPEFSIGSTWSLEFGPTDDSTCPNARQSLKLGSKRCQLRQAKGAGCERTTRGVCRPACKKVRAEKLARAPTSESSLDKLPQRVNSSCLNLWHKRGHVGV
jgi:hypothetical protein